MRLNITLIILAVGLALLFSTAQRAQQRMLSPLTETPRPADASSQQAGGPNLKTIASEELVAMRVGTTVMPKRETASRARAILSDARYAALERVAISRQFSLDKARIKGLVFPEGSRTIFIPAFDKQGRESGFLASDGKSWTLSLIDQKGERAVETYLAKLELDRRAIVEAGPKPKVLDPEGAHYEPVKSTTGSSASCQYVSKYSVNFGCWSPNSNPFGYYYVQVFRWGYTPDPRSPTWRACYRGAIHICPRYDSGIYSLPQCGFPPSHPQG